MAIINGDVDMVATAVENAVYGSVSMVTHNTLKVARSYVAKIINDLLRHDVIASLSEDDFMGAIAGTSINPAGTDGLYTFTVILSKGRVSQTTETLYLVIEATQLTVPDPDAEEHRRLLEEAAQAINDAEYAFESAIDAIAMTQSIFDSFEKASNYVQNVVDGCLPPGVAVLFVDGPFNTAVAGDAANMAGTDGDYTFTVTFSNSLCTSFPIMKTLTIKATPFVIPVMSPQPQPIPPGPGPGPGPNVSNGNAVLFTTPTPTPTPKPTAKSAQGTSQQSSQQSNRAGQIDSINGEAPKAGFEFSDIAGHWSMEWVIKAVEAGLVSGYDDGTFRPDNNITRAEYTKLVIEAFDIRVNGAATMFEDVIGHWAEPYINEAANTYLIVGVGDGMFEPDAALTREDAITILLRILTYSNAEIAEASQSIDYFDASDISGYARTAVNRLSQSGIVSGDARGYFYPQANLKRSEAVKLIVASLELAKMIIL
jgi:hypothetical protein